MPPDDATVTPEQIWTESSRSKATVILGAGFLVRPREVSLAPAGWSGLYSAAAARFCSFI